MSNDGGASTSRKGSPNVHWSVDATWAPIRLWEDRLEDLRRAKRNGAVYAEIAEALGALGFQTTRDQVHNKIENLCSTYRLVVSLVLPRYTNRHLEQPNNRFVHWFNNETRKFNETVKGYCRKPGKFIRTGTILVPSKGILQGLVLSPILFNLAIRKLPPLLERIPRNKHTLYANDLMIWTTLGSDGEKQDSLQEAIETVQNYLEASNQLAQLKPVTALEKSELLLVCTGKPTPKSREADICLTYKDGTPMLLVERIWILGLHRQRNGGAKYTVDRLIEITTQVMRMMRRITSRRQGLKESDLIRLTQALVVNQTTNVTPYLNMLLRRKGKMDVIMRKAYKLALEVPPYTRTPSSCGWA
ncbi:uncharacterized protein ISCGN_018938 [Ixodes scapularis]